MHDIPITADAIQDLCYYSIIPKRPCNDAALSGVLSAEQKATHHECTHEKSLIFNFPAFLKIPQTRYLQAIVLHLVGCPTIDLEEFYISRPDETRSRELLQPERRPRGCGYG